MITIKKTAKIEIKYSTIRRGIVLSMVVGTALNLINQGDLIFNNQFPKVSVLKVALTYVTPFIVSVYSTTAALLSRELQTT
jgi:hypothetical protein